MSSKSTTSVLPSTFQNLTYEQQQEFLRSEDIDRNNTWSSPTTTTTTTSAADLTLLQPYEGPRDENGRFHGRGGRIVLTGNVTYAGDFLHGRKHGIGMQTWPEGASFCGEWVHGEARGFGKLRLPSGGEYFGEVRGGVREGFGVFRSAEGSRYFGSWKNGKRHGFGIEIGEDGTYTGEWCHNAHHGWGTMQFGASLNRYTGEWKFDAMHGVGSMVWVTLKDQNKARKLWRRASSRMLMGLAAEKERSMVHLANQQQHQQSSSASSNLANINSNDVNSNNRRPSRSNSLMGCVSAQSLMLSSDDMQQYVGEWSQGCPDGNGELRRILLSASSSSLPSSSNNNNNNNNANKNHRTVPFEMGNHFQGSFKNGKRNGFGIQYFADGSAFEGTWLNNLKHGKGTMIRADGTLVHVTLHNDTIVSEKKVQQEQQEQQQQLRKLLDESNNGPVLQHDHSESNLLSSEHDHGDSVSLGVTQRTTATTVSGGSAPGGRGGGAAGGVVGGRGVSTKAPLKQQQQQQQQPPDRDQQLQENQQQVQEQQAPHTHVDISVKDICFSRNDERAVHITVSLVFVALRHLFHVYVGMQSGCGNLDDIYSAQTHSKLPEGIQRRSSIQPPVFVAAMSEEVLKANPIHHLSDFDGIVRLAEAHAETTLQLAARAAQKAMKTVMIFEHFMEEAAAAKTRKSRQSTTHTANSNNHNNSHNTNNNHQTHHHDNVKNPIVTLSVMHPQHQSHQKPNFGHRPISPILSSHSPSHDDVMDKFLAWSSEADVILTGEDEASSSSDAEENDKNAAKGDPSSTLQTPDPSFVQESSASSATANATGAVKSSQIVSSSSFAATPQPQQQQQQQQQKGTNKTKGRRQLDGASSSCSPPSFKGANSRDNDDDEHEKDLSPDHRNASIEQLFGQYDGAGNAASVAGTAAATSAAERRPLSTVLHLAGFMSLLRDAEVLSPDMTGHDVLEALEPLLDRRAHVPGAPGLTWPAFVEAVVRVAHKKLALSAVFCAQDQSAKAHLGARVHHFVKEYFYPLLRCIKDLESCPEASAIICVEQLEIAASENMTFESLRRATLRQLRAMTSRSLASANRAAALSQPTVMIGDSSAACAGGGTGDVKQQDERPNDWLFSNRRRTKNIKNNTRQEASNGSVNVCVGGGGGGGGLGGGGLGGGTDDDDDDINNNNSTAMSSEASTPRSVSESSIFKFGADGGNRSSMATSSFSGAAAAAAAYAAFSSSSSSYLPPTFDEAIVLLARQVDESVVPIKKSFQFARGEIATATANNLGSRSFSVPNAVAQSPALLSPSTSLPVQVVARGMELLQALCCGSWSQFPAAAQCEVIEKIQIQAIANRSAASSSSSTSSSSSSSSSSAVAGDIVEVWCVVSRPQKHSPQIRLHLLLVQIVKQTAEVRFVGFIPSSVMERLCVQCTRDSDFFERVASRALFRHHQHQQVGSNSNNAQLLPQGQRHPLKRQCSVTSLGVPRFSTMPAACISKKVSNVSINNTSVTTAPSIASSVNSFAANVTTRTTALKTLLSKFSLSHFVAASASHQLLRGSRFYSTASLVHFDALAQLYHSCDRSLGPLVAACTFSGLFLYPGVQKRTKRNVVEQSSCFDVSSVDVLRHCMHALYGVDPVTSPGGLFIDIKGNYTGFSTAGRKSVAGTARAKATFLSIPATAEGESATNNDNNNNNSRIQSKDGDDDLMSPDDAASAVLAALQTLAKNSKSYLHPGGDAKKFNEIAEAAKAKALQAVKSEQQRLVYHGDNWRSRAEGENDNKNKNTNTNNKNSSSSLSSSSSSPSWALAAMDLKLSFGEFVECVMIICGLSSSAASFTLSANDDPRKTAIATPNTVESSSVITPVASVPEVPQQREQEQFSTTKTTTADLSMTATQQEIDQNILRDVMRAATSTIGKRFVAASSIKCVSCSTFLLETFLQQSLPTIQYFVNVRSALPKMVPSYWAWAIADAYHRPSSSTSSLISSSTEQTDKQQQTDEIFDQLRANFFLSSQEQKLKQEHQQESRRRPVSSVSAAIPSLPGDSKTNQNESMMTVFTGRPISPIAFLNISDDNNNNNNNNSRSSDNFASSMFRCEDTRTTATTTSWSDLPTFTTKEAVEREIERDRANTTCVVSSKKLDWTSQQQQHDQATSTKTGLDEVKVFEILAAKERKQEREALLVEKIHTFHNKRYNDMIQNRQLEDEERIRQRQLLLASPVGKKGAAFRAGHQAQQQQSLRSGSVSPTRLQQQEQQKRTRSGSASSSSSPVRRGGGAAATATTTMTTATGKVEISAALAVHSPGKKKPKGYEPPKMEHVTKKVTVGTSVHDGSEGRVPRMIENELKTVADGKSTRRPDLSENGTSYYDDRLRRHVPLPSSMLQVVRGGLLLETPPITFTVQMIQEEQEKTTAKPPLSQQQQQRSKKGSLPNSGEAKTAGGRKNSVSPKKYSKTM